MIVVLSSSSSACSRVVLSIARLLPTRIPPCYFSIFWRLLSLASRTTTAAAARSPAAAAEVRAAPGRPRRTTSERGGGSTHQAGRGPATTSNNNGSQAHTAIEDQPRAAVLVRSSMLCKWYPVLRLRTSLVTALAYCKDYPHYEKRQMKIKTRELDRDTVEVVGVSRRWSGPAAEDCWRASRIILFFLKESQPPLPPLPRPLSSSLPFTSNKK